jgi:hypothetical protein
VDRSHRRFRGGVAALSVAMLAMSRPIGRHDQCPDDLVLRGGLGSGLRQRPLALGTSQKLACAALSFEEIVFESQSFDPSSEGNLPIGGEPNEVKHFLADVDADDHW